MAQRFVRVAQTVLDATGTGTATIIADGGDWRITVTTVSTSTHVLEPVASTYLNVVGDSGLLEGTFSGSADTSDTTYTLGQGESINCVWTGGDAGALATLRIQGLMGRTGEFDGA